MTKAELEKRVKILEVVSDVLNGKVKSLTDTIRFRDAHIERLKEAVGALEKCS